jgi:ubiquitin-protein ligase
MALARIAREHVNLQRDPLEACSVGPAKTDDSRWWVGHITGPPDTPYEQRNLSIAIVFPEDYPMKPFQLTFTTPLSHPSVSGEGEVRLPELEEKHWSPVLTVRSILICVQALLSNQDPPKRVTHSEAAEHNIGSNATGKCVEPTHHGRKIKGKTYMIDMSRPEYQEYNNLIKAEEKDEFFINYADMIRDL